MATIQVNNRFETMDDLRNVLRIFSTTNNCPLFMERSSKSRLVVRCPSSRKSAEAPNECGFRVVASQHKDHFIYVTQAQMYHADGCTAVVTPSYQAVKALTKPYLQSFTDVKPKDI